jgi:hypothetical protein
MLLKSLLYDLPAFALAVLLPSLKTVIFFQSQAILVTRRLSTPLVTHRGVSYQNVF